MNDHVRRRNERLCKSMSKFGAVKVSCWWVTDSYIILSLVFHSVSVFLQLRTKQLRAVLRSSRGHVQLMGREGGAQSQNWNEIYVPIANDAGINLAPPCEEQISASLVVIIAAQSREWAVFRLILFTSNWARPEHTCCMSLDLTWTRPATMFVTCNSISIKNHESGDCC